MSKLRTKLIRLAFDKPDLRHQILPLITAGSKGQWEPEYGTPLDGFTKQKASKLINRIMDRHTKGIFRDEYWKPVQDIQKEMNKLDMPFYITVKNGGYRKDKDGNLTSKEWQIEVPFINNKNRPTWLFGVIICSAAGTVSNPLSVYDVVAYVS
jgi:hypothetical protein